jgi:3-hydroxybutyryl-CoA dehydratase
MRKGDRYVAEFEVSEEVFEGFALLFKDRNPLHQDREYAQSKGFRDRVMYGNILNGFVSYFVGECLPTQDVILQKQEIRYMAPVYLGDRLTLHVDVADVFESVRSVELKYVFINSAGKKVAKGTILVGLTS